MINLIKNEYIKLFKKRSTIIWLIIVAVISVGFLSLVKIYQNFNGNDYYNSWSYTGDHYQDQIDYYESTKELGYEIEINYYQDLIDYKIVDYDWRMQSLDYAYRTCLQNATYGEDISDEEKEEYKKGYETLTKAVKDNDWKAYLEFFAKSEGSKKYTFEGNEDAITNIYQYMLDKDIEPDFTSVEYKTLSNIKDCQDQMESLQSDPTMAAQIEELKETWMLERYKMDNGFISTVVKGTSLEEIMSMPNNVWKYFKLSEIMVVLISVLMVILAGGIVASEYSTGTIKFLLINPKTRSKIIFSKLLTILTFTFVAMAGFFVINFVTSLFLGGFKDLGAVYAYVSNGKVHSYSAILLLVSEYLFNMVEVVMMASMAFAVSSLFKKAAMATGVGVACLIGGSTITQILALFNLDWGRYLLFANTDIMSISDGTSMFVGHTLVGAIINLSIHLLLFILIGHDAFTRREV